VTSFRIDLDANFACHMSLSRLGVFPMAMDDGEIEWFPGSARDPAVE